MAALQRLNKHKYNVLYGTQVHAAFPRRRFPSRLPCQRLAPLLLQIHRTSAARFARRSDGGLAAIRLASYRIRVDLLRQRIDGAIGLVSFWSRLVIVPISDREFAP